LTALVAAVAIKVAVLDLATHGIDEATAKALSEVLSVEISARPGIQVITAADAAAILGFERQRLILGCESDTACITELAGALGADKIVSGSVSQIEEVFLLNLRLINVRKGLAEGRVYERVEKKSALIDAVRAGAQRLFESGPAPAGSTAPGLIQGAPVPHPGPIISATSDTPPAGPAPAATAATTTTAAPPAVDAPPAPAAATEPPAAHVVMVDAGWGLVGLGVVSGVAGAVLQATNAPAPPAPPTLGYQLGQGSLWFGLGALAVGGVLLLSDFLIFGVQEE
jgi:hypothetical protein